MTLSVSVHKPIVDLICSKKDRMQRKFWSVNKGYIMRTQPNQLNNFDLQMFTPLQQWSNITLGKSIEDPIVFD